MTWCAGKSESSRLQIVLALKLLATHSSFAVSIASCRHPIQLLFGFGETPNCRNNIRCTKLLVLLSKVMLKYAQQKRSSLRYHRSVPNETPHEAKRAALSETGSRVDDLNNRQDQTPEFALILFV